MDRLTRVLVFAGVITVVNSARDIRGESPDLLTAEQENAPVRMAVQANNDFAWRLYARLVSESPDGNLFFSPYSVATALAMALEGARGETALEMGRALGYPDAARRIGDDAQLIPWRTALLQTGRAQLQQRLSAPEDDATQAIRARITVLRARLDAANRRTEELDRQNQFDDAFEAQREARKLARDINELLTQIDQYQFTVANAIWGDRSFPFDDDYVETINRAFQSGGVFPVDFTNDHERARNEINAWVERQTAGMIPELLEERSVSPMTRLILTNAVYFLGQWSEPFDENATEPAPFHLATGETIEFPAMHGWKNEARYGAVNADGSWFTTPVEVRADNADADKRYPGDDGFQILEMPYKGAELSMVFLLPRAADGLSRLQELLTADRLGEWLAEAAAREVQVTVPKFEAEGSYRLRETLQQLGMELAFSSDVPPSGADFSGMTVSQDRDHQLCLGDVIHKARISLDEKGTEAVAATAVVLEPAAAPPAIEMVPFTPEFRADRPFVYLIRDRQTGAVLFVGNMQNPADG